MGSIINYAFIKILLLITYKFDHVKAVDCRRLTDCYSCASSMDGMLPCHWCISTRTCTNSFEALQCSEFMRVQIGYNCPFVPQNDFQYFDMFARTRGLAFMSAAKSGNTALVKKL